jgi:hypothetical protein
LVADRFGIGADDDVLAPDSARLELAVEHGGCGDRRDRPWLDRIIGREIRFVERAPARQAGGEGGHKAVLMPDGVGKPPDRVLVVVPDADRAELRVPAEHVERRGICRHRRIARNIGVRARPKTNRQGDSARALDRLDELSVVSRVAAGFEHHVEEDAPGARRGELVGELRVVAPRPRPAADLAHGSIVDADEDDVAARLVLVEAVAAGAQQVFRQLTEADEPEDQSDDRRPQQQLPRRSLGLWFVPRRHRAPVPLASSLHLCREKVIK